MPIQLSLASKRSWAFAKDLSHSGKLRYTGNCIITACSKEAKLLGIRAGMHYEDALRLVPQIKIHVLNWR